MRDRFLAWTVLLLVAGPAVAAPAADLSEQRFLDWCFYNDAGWRAANRGDYARAAERFRMAIKVLRPEWERAPRLHARSYADLGWALYQQGHTDEAEPLMRWALGVRVAYGPESEPAAQSYYQLALVQNARSKLSEAETLMRKSLAAWEKQFGPYDLRVSFYLTELARLLIDQRKLDEAESIYRRVLGRPERTLPPRHPYRVVSLIGLGRIYTAKGEPLRAEFQDRQVLPMLQQMRPSEYPEVAEPLSLYIGELKRAGRVVAATQLEDSARVVLVDIDKRVIEQHDALERVVRAARGDSAKPSTDAQASSAVGLKGRPGPKD